MPQARPMSAYQPSCAGLREPEPGLGAEDRGEALDRAEDRVGDDRRDERGDQRVRLDVVAVEELGPEDGAAERRPEDRADAGGHADRDRDPRITRVEVQQLGRGNDPNPALIWAVGSLATARAAGADGDGRGDELDERDAAPDAARAVVNAAIAASVPWPSASGAKR